MITIKDVAKHCNVAKSTVSNALTGKKYVSPELKRRIMDACRELDFQPNFYASALSHGTSKILALVLEQDSNVNYRGFYTPLIVSCLKTAAAAGRHLLVYSGLGAAEASVMLKRNKAPIDGAILMTPLVDDTRIAQMEQQRIPCVVIGRPSGDAQLSYVDLDNVSMLKDVVARLYAAGWRRFCLFNSVRSMTISIDRARGFGEAISSRADAEGVVVYPDEEPAPPEKGTAYITSDGNIAGAIYGAAEAAGLDPAKDIKLYSLGEDDERGVKWEYARQDYGALGRRAMEILLKECEGETALTQLVTDYYTV